MKLRTFCMFAIAASIVGCTQPGPSTTANDSGTVSKGDSAVSTADGGPKLDTLPASLQNEAFEYYGLNNPNPIDMEVTQAGSGSVVTGSQTNVLKSVSDKGAVFAIERTGGLAQMGSATVLLKPDGIYLDTVMGTKSDGNEIELPNNLTPGRTWTSHMAFSSGGSSMDVTSQCTVKGIEKFKTKVGDREGVLIVSTGRGKMNGEDIQLDSKSWYVKGVGGVRSELTTTFKKSGKKQTITFEETK